MLKRLIRKYKNWQLKRQVKKWIDRGRENFCKAKLREDGFREAYEGEYYLENFVK